MGVVLCLSAGGRGASAGAGGQRWAAAVPSSSGAQQQQEAAHRGSLREGRTSAWVLGVCYMKSAFSREGSGVKFWI